MRKGTFEVKDPTGRKMRQDYSNRIIIPIFDLDGNLKSFQGRDTTGEAEKRIYSHRCFHPLVARFITFKTGAMKWILLY
ncbi:DNA primase [Xanthomonas phage JGB6]|nr:DNA primase [Xanthomonas phage JGB6]